MPRNEKELALKNMLTIWYVIWERRNKYDYI